jgi:hypothetical protein
MGVDPGQPTPGEGEAICRYDRALRNGPEATYSLWRRWRWDKKIAYIDHMEACAKRDPVKFRLFAEIVTAVMIEILEN